MLDARDLAAYAEAVGKILREMGPMAGEDVLATLRGPDISEEDAEAVLVYALCNGILIAEDGAFHAGPADA